MSRSRRDAASIDIAGNEIAPGSIESFELPVGRLVTQNSMTLPVRVVHGARPGPRLWLSGAVHGDEINGVEIIRQVLRVLDPMTLRGTVVAVPIVNVFGFINESRYLPDRRDLNRSFPGSANGSLAARIAHLFLRDIVDGCDYGIDLHTGADGRSNFPQIRADLDDSRTLALAQAFGTRVLLHSRVRDGSLRGAAVERGIPVLVYEGGEPRRFNGDVIRQGARGILRVLASLQMRGHAKSPSKPPLIARDSQWVRARRSGLLRLDVKLGQRVVAKEVMGIIADAFGDREVPVKARAAGIVVGAQQNPLVNRGDALVHVARVES